MESQTQEHMNKFEFLHFVSVHIDIAAIIMIIYLGELC